MTIFSDAYLPYPYGPVPSPGTPSPKFVDLLNNQTVGGDKTFSGRTSIARPAQVGGAEEHLRFTVSDDAAASLVLLNGDTTDGAFVPVISWSGTALSSSYTAGQQRVRLGAGMDAGSTPAMAYFFQTSTGTSISTRPLCGWYSGTTNRVMMAASGAMTYTIGAQTGVAETLAQWNVSDSANTGVYLFNLSTTDATMSPSVRLVASGNLGSVYASVGSLDTGSAYGMTFAASGPAGAAFVTRSPYQWLNGPTQIADFTPGGSYRLTQAGQGFRIAEGANCKQGVATLVAGTVTVANTSVTANSRIHATGQDGGVTGAVNVSARTPGVSFTLTSSNPADSGVVAYTIFEPS